MQHTGAMFILAMFRHSFADLLLLPGSKSQSSKRRLSNMANTAIWKGLSAPAGGMWRKWQRNNSHPARSERWCLPGSAALTRRESCDRRWRRSGDSPMDRNQLQPNPKCQDTNANFCFFAMKFHSNLYWQIWKKKKKGYKYMLHTWRLSKKHPVTEQENLLTRLVRSSCRRISR